MSLADRLIKLMDERGINRSELAKGAGLPYTTVVAIFENGGDNTKLSTLRKLAAYFEVTLDELASEPVSAKNEEAATALDDDLTEEDIKKIEEYKQLLRLSRKLKTKESSNEE